MKMWKLSAAVAALAFLLAGSAVQAAEKTKNKSRGQRAGTASRTAGDTQFIMKAAQGGMAEVRFGELAKGNASSDAVKQFGQKMVDDHSKANDELKQIASNKGVTLPSDLDAKDKAEYDRLSKLKGAAFDRAYMQFMTRDHRHDVAEFRQEAEHGSDPDVKAFASKTLPTLEEHGKLARQTAAQVRK